MLESLIVVTDLDESEVLPVPNTNPGYWNAAISPDGARLAHTRYMDGHRRIILQNLDGTDKYVLPNTPGEAYQPAWSPSGDQLAFTTNNQNEGTFAIYVINVDGTGLRKLVSNAIEPDWSP